MVLGAVLLMTVSTQNTLCLPAAAFPGPLSPPKVVSAFNDCITLSWDSPSNKGGSRILGYILEKRKKGSNLWTVVNAMDELIKGRPFLLSLLLLQSDASWLWIFLQKGHLP